MFRMSWSARRSFAPKSGILTQFRPRPRWIAALFGASALAMFVSLDAGAQTAHFAGAQAASINGFAEPRGVAVDSQGNIYVADTNENAVKEILAVNGYIPASPSIRTLGSGFSLPYGVAVDSHGNVFVADFGDNAIKEIEAVYGSIPASPTIQTLVNVSAPIGIAVDSNANVFYTDTENGSIKELTAASGYTAVSTVATEYFTNGHWVFMHLGGIAVDRSGDVFATDSADNGVYEIYAVNGSIPPSPQIVQLGSGFDSPEGLAVDSAGDVFTADYNNNVVKEMLAVNGTVGSSPTILALGNNLHFPSGVAIDSRAHLFIADTYNSRVVEVMTGIADFGSLNTGSTSPPLSVSFTFDTAGTLGSTAVVHKESRDLILAMSGLARVLRIPTMQLGRPARST